MAVAACLILTWVLSFHTAIRIGWTEKPPEGWWDSGRSAAFELCRGDLQLEADGHTYVKGEFNFISLPARSRAAWLPETYGWQIAIEQQGGRSLGFPLALFCVPSVMAVRRWRRRFGPGKCQRCGYDLRATPDKCPECGATPAAAE